MMIIFLVIVAVVGADRSVYSAVQPAIRISVDAIELPLKVRPVVEKGGLLLEAKETFKAMRIQWKYEKKTIVIHYRGIVFTTEINRNRVMAGEREVRMAQAPVARQGRIFIPADLIGIVLGKTVVYDTENRILNVGLTAEERTVIQRDLFEAAKAGNSEKIEMLLERGADPNGKLSEYGESTPLREAVVNDKTDAVHSLLVGGAKTGYQDTDLAFGTLLTQNARMLNLLLDSGLDSNAKNHSGTLLERASGFIDISKDPTQPKFLFPLADMVNTLIEHGAKPRLDNSLINAVEAQNYEIIQSLIRAGANLNKVGMGGKTPYELSKERHINRWLTIREEPPALPSFSVTDDWGNTIVDGSLILRDANNKDSVPKSIIWRGNRVYADLPDGKYTLLNVDGNGLHMISPLSSSIAIQGGKADPDVVKLPSPNVSGTLTSESIQIDGGRFFIVDKWNKWFYSVPVSGDRFTLYAPEGHYRISSYTGTDRVDYAVDGIIAINGDPGIQNIIVNLKKDDASKNKTN